MPRIYVKPAIDKSADQKAGEARLKVRKPIGGHLAPQGEWQNLDSYWQRRINDQDVEVIEGLVEEGATQAAAAPTAPPPQGTNDDSGAAKADRKSSK